MDIIGAMNKEREYLSFRMKGEEPFHLVDAVKEYGFNSLKDYFDAKRDYEFSQLKFEVVETTPERAIAEVMSTIEAKKTALLFAITNKTLVWNGNGGQYNAEYCNECGIPVYPYLTGGGTIVSNQGDINIGICVPDNLQFNSGYFLERLAKILQKYTYKNVIACGNDVLVDNIKVIGGASYLMNGMFMFVASMSLSDKTELIKCICQKHSNKQPGYIDFVDANTIMLEIKKWQTQ